MAKNLFFFFFLVHSLTLSYSSVFQGEPECTNWESSNPAWIWCDDFDTNTLQVNYPTERNVGGSTGMSLSTEDFFSGDSSLQQVYSIDQVNAGWIAITDREITFPSDGSLFYRHYHKFANDFEGDPDKWSRMRHRDRSVWRNLFEVNTWMFRDTGEIYLDTQMPSRWWRDLSGLKPSEEPLRGEWICVEVEAKLNTPGQSDGYHRMWINDEEVAFRENMPLRGSYSVGFNEVMLDAYWNTGSNKNDNKRYWDNFVVSTQRIGCLSSDGVNDDGEGNDEVEELSIEINDLDSNTISSNSIEIAYTIEGEGGYSELVIFLNDAVYSSFYPNLDYPILFIDNLDVGENSIFLELVDFEGNFLTSSQTLTFNVDIDGEVTNENDSEDRNVEEKSSILDVEDNKSPFKYTPDDVNCSSSFEYTNWTQCRNSYQLREVIDVNECVESKIEKKLCGESSDIIDLQNTVVKNQTFETLEVKKVNESYLIEVNDSDLTHRSYIIKDAPLEEFFVINSKSDDTYLVSKNVSSVDNLYTISKIEKEVPLQTQESNDKERNFSKIFQIIGNLVLGIVIFGGIFFIIKRRNS